MNNFQIYEEIGKGRYSTVYKGRRKKSITYFAISSVDKSQRQRVLNSVHFLRALSHAHIISFHSWYETNNHLWIITEYCTGGDLRTVLDAQKKFSEKSISVLCGDVAEGLMYMHSKGAIYADLKPSNLLLDASAQLRFYDFGLAQSVESVGVGQASRVGTPCYMAPELFMDDGVHSFASDIWAFGCLMYEMFAGVPPFVHHDLKGLMEAIANEPYKPLADASPAFKELLDGMLCKDPADRMTWSDIAASDFWLNKMPTVPQFPKEPQFAAFTNARREPQPKRQEQTRNSILRASINAERNLTRELRAKGGYQQDSAGGLKMDREIDFSEAGQEGGDEEAAASSSTHPVSPDEAPAEPTGSSPVLEFQQPLPQSPPGEGQSKLPSTNGVAEGSSPTVESLLSHASDNYARPIVMNSRIERYSEPKFEVGDLTFPARTVPQLKAMPPKELEAFLTSVYRSLAQASPVLDKSNTLAYFESLCCDTQVANAVINSSIMSLCVKMLHTNPMPSNIRAQLATVMGLLLRYATVIHAELRKTNIINVLMETLDVETQQRARRRMLSCLGELLFYIATQKPASQQQWEVDKARVAATYGKALHDQDEVLVHSAVKAIENISSLTDKALSTAFATKEFVGQLLSLYGTATIKNEHLRSSAFCSALRVCFVDPKLIPVAMAYLSPATYSDILLNSNQRCTQALLTFLNLFLSKAVALLSIDCGEHHVVRHVAWSSGQPDSLFSTPCMTAPAIRQVLLDLMSQRDRFMTGLCAAIEHSSAAIRGKSALTVLLMTVAETTFLSQAGDFKLFPCLEKLARDKDVYPQRCMQMLYQLLSFFVYVTVSQISRCVPSTGFGMLADDLVVTLHVMTSSSLRHNISLSDDFLAMLGECVNKLPLFHDAVDHHQNVFLLLEALSQDKQLITNRAAGIVQVLLPPVVAMLANTKGDTRFAAIRCLHDFLAPIVSDTAIYDPSNPSCAVVQLVHDFVGTVLPHIEHLLKDTEPIPLFTLKLLSACCEKSVAILGQISNVGILTTLIGFLASQHQKNSVYVLNLILRILQFGGEQLVVVAVRRSLVSLISAELSAAADLQDQFLDACTEIMFFMLCSAMKNAEIQAACFPWVSLLRSILLRMCADKRSYSECAATSVLTLTQLYQEAQVALLDPAALGIIRQALSDADEAAHQIIIPLIKALHVCASHAPPESVRVLQQEELLLVQLQVLAQSGEEKSLAQAAGEVISALYAN